MHNFKELIVWKEGRKLTKAIYIVSRRFPQDERFGLTAQIRRCAVSVVSNIAEGAGRRTDKDFLHFLSISAGSLYELETQLWLAYDLEYVAMDEIEEILEAITALQKMLYRLQDQLQSKLQSV